MSQCTYSVVLFGAGRRKGIAIRKFLIVVGALTCIVVVLGVVALILAIRQDSALEAEAKSFVDRTVTAASEHWCSSALLAVSTPELKKHATAAVWETISSYFDKLGALRKYQGCVGSVSVNYSTGAGSTITGSYLAQATFANGTATFKVYVSKKNGVWLIAGFWVDAKIKSASQGEKGT